MEAALRALLRPKLIRAKKLWAKPVLAVITLLRIMAVIKDQREASKRKRLTALFVGASVIGWARHTLRCRTLGRCRTLELPSPCYKPLTDEALGLSTASEDASEDPARRRQVVKRSRRTRIVESTGAEDEPPSKRVRINEPTTMEEMRQTVLDLVNTEDEVTRHIYGLLKLYPVFRPFINLRVSAERPTALHDAKSRSRAATAAAASHVERHQTCTTPHNGSTSFGWPKERNNMGIDGETSDPGVQPVHNRTALEADNSGPELQQTRHVSGYGPQSR